MHSQIELPKDPIILEKILKYFEIFKLPIDQKLISSPVPLTFDTNFPIKFSELNLNIYQFIQSNQGRGLIVDKPQFSSRVIGCAWVFSKNLFPLVICSNKKNYPSWQYLISKFFPNKKLVIQDPNEIMTNDFDILLTTPKDFLYKNIDRKIDTKQIIIDDIVQPLGIIRLRNNEILKGISSEYYQTLFLLNLESIDVKKQYLREENIENYFWNNHKSLVSEIIDKFLAPKLKFNTILWEYRISYGSTVAEHLKIQDRISIEFLKLLGVNTDLLNKKHVSCNIKSTKD